MPFSISGRIAAGADQALEEVLDRRLKEAIRQDQERQHAAENLMRQQGIDLQRETLAGAKEDRAADNARQQQVVDLQLRKDTAAQAEKAANTNRASDMAGVLAMPGMTDEAKANEMRGSAIRMGADPLKVIEGLTKAPPRTPTRTVTVKGPNGRPMEKAFTDEELQQGVERYVEPPKPDRPPRENLTPGQQFQATRSLRNDYVRETAAAKTVTQQLKMMHDAMAEIDKGNIPASSEAVIVTFNKILDPNSVVREGEYARSLQGQAYLKQLESQWQKAVQGGNIIPSELRKFVTLSERFAENSVKSARESQRQIDAIADEFGLKKDNITRDYDAPANTPDAGGGGGVPGAAPKTKTAYELWKERQGGK